MRNLFMGGVAVALLAITLGPQAGLAQPAGEAAALPSSVLTVPPPRAGRARPLVAVVTTGAGAETTDFIIPYGVLKDSGVADVVALSTTDGPVQLMRAIRVAPDATTARFDLDQPTGADIVVVPAQMNSKDPVLRAWLRSQAERGAVIVSICEGARVLAHAGLLDGRRAATHWGALKSLEKAYPRTTWVRDRRYLQDGPIISTTGVSASIPASLALVEAIGGRATALAAARRLGLTEWSAAHRTADFALTRADMARAVGSLVAVWSHETVEFPIAQGVDEVALALKTDVWTRTVRSRVAITSAAPEVRSSHGLRILPDARPEGRNHQVETSAEPAQAQLEEAFAAVARRYGAGAEKLAKVAMEYDPVPPSARATFSR